MRTHYLKDLEIQGKLAALKVLPTFDFYRLNEVVRIVFERVEGAVQIVLTAIYTDAKAKYSVTLKFVNSTHARLPDLSPLFSLAEMEIEDIRADQLEGLKYKTKCFGMTEFEVLSGDIIIGEVVASTE